MGGGCKELDVISLSSLAKCIYDVYPQKEKRMCTDLCALSRKPLKRQWIGGDHEDLVSSQVSQGPLPKARRSGLSLSLSADGFRAALFHLGLCADLTTLESLVSSMA